MPSDTLSYQVVFDVSRQLPQGWWRPALPVAIAVVLVRFAPQQTTAAARVFNKLFLGFAVVLAIVIAAGTWATYHQLRSALEHGDHRLVEGTVTDFVPEERMIKRPESFIVVTRAGGIRYTYARSIGTQGLNHSHGHIRNGLRVRIADVDGKIARLEIAREAPRR